jgi:hypothetical protein
MSKFARPKPTTPATPAEIDRVIQGADAVDDRREGKPAQEEGEVRFTMTLPADMARRVDHARKGAGRLTRLSWLRMAAVEKLNRDGM